MFVFDYVKKDDQNSKLLEELEASIKDYDSSLNPDHKLDAMSNMLASLKAISLLDSEQDQEGYEPTSHFYSQNEKRTLTQRQKDNNAAIALLKSIQAEGRTTATDEEKAILAKYSGNGGGLTDAKGNVGSAYEYYTPPFVAEAAWRIMTDMGFGGGKVLDPCAGSGVFAATRPKGVMIEQVELDTISGGINSLVNGNNLTKTTISPFEKVASNTEDESYDAIVSNVPFGSNADRGSNKKHDDKYQDYDLAPYFIMRSIDKLKPNGLAMFVLPHGVINSKSAGMEKLRYQVSKRAEFIGAYRLPNKIFKDTSSADAIVDIALFKKHSNELKDKINETDDVALSEANVLWGEFLKGEYFQKSGSKYQFGKFVERDKSNMHSRDQVETDMSIPEMMQAMRGFGGSRIKWSVLDVAEEKIISYSEGDTQFIDGQQMTFKGGEWVIAKDETEDYHAQKIADNLSVFDTPLKAVNSDSTYKEAYEFLVLMLKRGKSDSIPRWLNGVMKSVSKIEESGREQVYQVVVVGLAIRDVRRTGEKGANFLEIYSKLSDKIKSYAIKSNASRKMLSGADDEIKSSCQELPIVYDSKSGFSAFWRGEIGNLDNDTELTAKQRYERARYQYSDDFGYIPLDKLKTELGDDFNPLIDDDYCVSGDGKSAIQAVEYYQGTQAKVLERIDAEIQSAKDPKIIEKLLWQKKEAHNRVNPVNIDRMTFNIHSPYVSLDMKLQFLREQISPDFAIEIDNEGNEIISYVGRINTIEEKLLKRLSYYVQGKSLTLGGAGSEGAEKTYEAGVEQRLLTQLRNMAESMNAQMNVWAKSDSRIRDMINARLNSPENLRYPRYEDEADLEIAGINPDFKPHGYQRAEIRRQADHFGGINGFGVGLGKTATSLLSVQYAQSIGVKRKTLFVVPNAVLSNWRKEAVTGKGKKGETGYQPSVLANGDKCLFVGMDVDASGNASVKSSNYSRDMHKILENNHSMVFMSLEAFTRIPLKDETVEDYKGFLSDFDSSLALKENSKGQVTNKSIESSRSKTEKMVKDVNSSSIFPFFEDMGFDSLVIDEAHQLKNSKELVDFKGAKFLSVAPASDRGNDAQIKAWFIRGLSPKGDGVLGLTATPITNSPLEIYSMLSLTVGERELSKRLGGISGADDFMNVVANVSERDDTDIVGRPRVTRVFTGLNNTAILKNILHDIANIKDAEDVGNAVKLPEANKSATKVSLDAKTMAEIEEMKLLYKVASRVVRDKLDDVTFDDLNYLLGYVGLPIMSKTGNAQIDGDSVAEAVAMLQLTPEVVLLGHPFNLINKMSNRIIDKDLSDRVMRLEIQPTQIDKAKKIVETWNKKPPTEKREQNSSYTQNNSITYLKENDESSAMMNVKIMALIEENQIILDTTSYDYQNRFMAMVEKEKLVVSVSISPKVAAFIENYNKEKSMPAMGSFAKQIVFADQLGIHVKLKLILSQQCNESMSKIAIISGQAISDPADMQDVQDGFNEDEDNKYHTVIANKKGEVGINLQKRTQAIHHLTIGWTPDSLTQRDGRGVRQGNILDSVNVYYYDAKGTFDEYKRELVSKKDEWISQLMNGSDGDTDSVKMSEGLSDQEYDDLIMAGDDPDKIAKIKSGIEIRKQNQEILESKRKQAQLLSVVKANSDNIKTFSNDEDYLSQLSQEHYDLVNRIEKLKRSLNSMTKQESIARATEMLNGSVARKELLDSLFSDGLQYADYNGVINPFSGETPYNTKGNNKKIDGLRYNARQIVKGSRLDSSRNAEIAKAQTALESARLMFKKAGVSGAYGDDTLEKIEGGNAVSVNGEIITVGMVGIDSATGSIKIVGKVGDKLVMQGLEERYSIDVLGMPSSVTVYERNGKDWDMVTGKMAQYDEAFIAKGVTFEDSRKLYSFHYPEVIDKLKEKPSATYVSIDSFEYLNAPYFPKLSGDNKAIDSYGSQEETRLAQFVFWQQNTIVSYLENGVIKIADLYAINKKAEGIQEKALILATANNVKIGTGDLVWLGDRSGNGFRREISASEIMKPFDVIINDGLSGKYNSVELFDKAIDDAQNELLIMFTDSAKEVIKGEGKLLESIVGYAFTDSHKKYIKARDCSKNDGVLIEWYSDLPRDQKTELGNQVANKFDIKEHLSLIASNKEDGSMTIADNDTSRETLVKKFLLGDFDEKLGGYRLQDWAVQLLSLDSVPMAKESDIKTMAIYTTKGDYSGWYADAVKAVKAVNDKLINQKYGDVDAMIEKIKSIDGFTDAVIGSTKRSTPDSRFSGYALFNEGEYIAVSAQYKHPNASKMSDGKSGIEGRRWYKQASYWLFMIEDGKTDSKGMKIASINDLFKFYGV